MTNKKEDLNLKGPDMLQLKSAAVADYLRRHSKAVGAGLAVIVVAVLAGIGIKAILENQKEELRQDLTQIEKTYEDELKAFSDKQENLQNELDKLKLEQQKAADDDKAALDKKVAALEAQTAEAKPDHSGSKEEFLKFYNNHKNDPSGWVAGVRYAGISLENRELEKARDILAEVAEKSNQYPIIHTQSRLMLIATLEDLGQFDEALKHAEQLLSASREELKPKVLLTKGRLLVFKEDYEQAQKTLTEIVEQHAGSQEAESAKSMMALLF
ncbi:MAG: tetratricopeptide repeat protein [Oligoflexus sp.]